MRRLIATCLFVVLLPFAILIIVCQTVCEETWRAWRSIYLGLRADMSDLPRAWRQIRDL